MEVLIDRWRRRWGFVWYPFIVIVVSIRSYSRGRVIVGPIKCRPCHGERGQLVLLDALLFSMFDSKPSPEVKTNCHGSQRNKTKWGCDASTRDQEMEHNLLPLKSERTLTIEFLLSCLDWTGNVTGYCVRLITLGIREVTILSREKWPKINNLYILCINCSTFYLVFALYAFLSGYFTMKRIKTFLLLFRLFIVIIVMSLFSMSNGEQRPNSTSQLLGLPGRHIFNSTSFSDPENNMDMVPNMLMYPLPYGFIELMRRGTGLLHNVDHQTRRANRFLERIMGWQL